MTQINSEKLKNKKYNLVYMAKPPYGGWVSFTAHLSRKFNYPLFKIGNNTESKTRPYGYGVDYQNVTIADILKKGKILITAVDKKFYPYLEQIKKATIVIHDPTELKPDVIEFIKKDGVNVITIRKTVKKLLKEKHNIHSKFLYHPFYSFDIKTKKKTQAVSISRVDFDKHTDIILKANKKLKNPVKIYGALNDLYVYHGGLKQLGFDKYYKGKFEKTFESIGHILEDSKFVVDMSAIKNDGGGSQYTFLEAIHCECALVLNKKWVEGTNSPFKDKINCFVVENEDELIKLLNSNPKIDTIVKNAKKMLSAHINVKW
jgi:hypothetical protein